MKVVTYGEQQPSWLLLAVCFLFLPFAAYAQTDDDSFRAVVAEFGDANFREKESIAEQLLETGHASARAVLTALLEDRLFFRQQDSSRSSLRHRTKTCRRLRSSTQRRSRPPARPNQTN